MLVETDFDRSAQRAGRHALPLRYPRVFHQKYSMTEACIPPNSEQKKKSANIKAHWHKKGICGRLRNSLSCW